MQLPKKEKVITKQQAFIKACAFCAYQERLQEEVRQKLRSMGIAIDTVEDIISDLISNNFLNEERYAKAFAGGKFRIKKWGRVKIQLELEQKRLSAYCIRKGLEEIGQEEYIETLRGLIDKKKSELESEKNEYLIRHKISKYVIGKGYEPDLVWQELKKQST